MITFPNAKINIGLNILEKRIDGFHNIETCFYPIGLKDILEIIPSHNMNLITSGISIDTKEEPNICIKAYNLLRKDFSLPKLNIALHKKIPVGAGLGGGSSNGAFMIKSLNTYCKLKLSDKEQVKYATQLGADCAFFINNQPTIGTQKGEKLEAIDNFSLKNKFLILVYPNFSIHTNLAYSKIQPKKTKVNIKEVLANEPIQSWSDKIKNDFEEPIFSRYPELAKIKQTLYNSGALFASMSGSGSSIYGIFDQNPDSKNFDKYNCWTEILS